MQNNYEIRGNCVAVLFKNGLETLIDIEDLEKVDKATDGFWYVSNRGYISGRINKETKLTLMHRFIMNFPECSCIDHINRNKLDNRKENLREASKSENAQNRTAGTNNKSCGIRGVSWDKNRNKWIAQVKVNYKTIFGGHFDNIQDAKKAAEELRKKHMPFSLEWSC